MILATIVITTFLVIFSMNFHRPEKSVRHHVEHCHAIDDPQFRREMDAILGPAVLAGNEITALRMLLPKPETNAIPAFAGMTIVRVFEAVGSRGCGQ